MEPREPRAPGVGAQELDARLKIGEGSIETLEVALDAKTISNLEIGAWRTVAGDIDVLLGIPAKSRTELARSEQLMANASTLEVGDARVPVASLEDVIRSKEISDRGKDRAALAELLDCCWSRARKGAAGRVGSRATPRFSGEPIAPSSR